MQIDKGFYFITQTVEYANTQNKTLAQDFAQILTQEIQKEAKFTGNVYQDELNDLLSSEEKRILPVVIDAAQYVVGLKMAHKNQLINANDFDINFNEFGGRVKQKEILINGSKAEKMELLNSYKQALEGGYVIPQGGKQALDIAINYIDKALNDLSN